MCSWQSPTHGWCLRPKVLSLREVTATAARMTLAALVCMFMEAIKHCLPTNTALLMTSTAMTLTPGHGKSRHAHTHIHMLPSSFMMYSRLCIWHCALHVFLSYLTHFAMLVFQVHFEREQLSTVPALSCAPQRHPAHLRWQHAQRHITQQRGQVFLCWLPCLWHR